LCVTNTGRETLKGIVSDLPGEIWLIIRGFSLSDLACFSLANHGGPVLPPTFFCDVCEVVQPMRFSGNVFSYSEFGDHIETTTKVVPNNRQVFNGLPKRYPEVSIDAFDAILPQDVLKSFRLDVDSSIYMLEVHETDEPNLIRYNCFTTTENLLGLDSADEGEDTGTD
jgi:hypothetical protein